MAGKTFTRKLMYSASMKQLCGPKSTWNMDSVLYGLEALKRAASDDKHLISLNDRGANLIYFPSTAKGKSAEHPPVIVCAGGAYTNVCSIAEAYPVAARLNELGYPAFVLTYYVGKNAIMPKPLEDLALAVKWVLKHYEKYLLAGFSAGANLIAEWGTKHLGYEKYKLQAPDTMFVVYTFINVSLVQSDKSGDAMCKAMYGKDRKAEEGVVYNVDEHMDKDYPPCYIVCCEDDDLIPYENSILMQEKLRVYGVLSELEVGKYGGHGFGEGRGTSVEGWIERAVEFYEKSIH